MILVKRILNILFVIFVSVSLISCAIVEEPKVEETKEEINNDDKSTSFDEYLKNNKLDINQLNELININIEDNFVANLQIPSSNITVNVDNFDEYLDYDESKIKLWQQDKELFLYSEKDENANLYKLDLLEVEQLITKSLPDLSQKQFSDIVDLLLLEIFKEKTVKFEEIINKINFNIDDFIIKGEDTYELKHESIAKLIASFYGESLSEQDALDFLKENFKKLLINVQFYNNKIHDIGILIETNIDDIEIKTSLSISLIYENNELIGFDFGNNIFINYFSTDKTDFIVNSYGTITKDKIQFVIKVISDETIELEFLKQKTGFDLSISKEDEEKNIKLFNVKYLLEEEKLKSVQLLYLTKINKEQQKLELVLNVEEEFEIPSIDLKDAIDILDQTENEH